MRFLGIVLFVVALLALGLQFIGAGLRFMQWSEQWGAATAMGIKLGLALLGLALWRFAPPSK